MKTREMWIVLVILGGLALYGLLGNANDRLSLGDSPQTGEVEGHMPLPDGPPVEETIVDMGMPVPGLEGVEEMIVHDEQPGETAVSSNMPVPGLGPVEEMIVDER